MFDRIIVPLDGTPFAESALAPARELASHFNSSIVVVRAEDVLGAPHGIVAAEPQAELERVGEVDAYLHEIVDALHAGGYRADLMLALEAPATGIAEATERSHADLIILATHLRWNAALVQQVSTTLQVLTRTRVPMLIWRSLPTGPLPKGSLPAEQIRAEANEAASTLLLHPHSPIVVPLDGSAFAESALPPAEALARALKTSLVLVRAVGVAVPDQRDRAELDHAAQMPLLRALSAANAYLEQQLDQLRSRGIATEAMSRVGSPMGVISGALREYDASLVILASHGESGRKERFLGSIAAELIEEVEVPVLVVHPQAQPEVC